MHRVFGTCKPGPRMFALIGIVSCLGLCLLLSRYLVTANLPPLNVLADDQLPTPYVYLSNVKQNEASSSKDINSYTHGREAELHVQNVTSVNIRRESTFVTGVEPSPQHLQPTPQHLQPSPQHLQPSPQHSQLSPQHLLPSPQHLHTSSHREKERCYSLDGRSRTKCIVESMCPSLDETTHSALTNWDKPLIEDIMLIVTLNNATLFSNVPTIEAIHRPVFRHIVYCGPDRDVFLDAARNMSMNNVTYIEIQSWFYFYACVSQAMELGLSVKGYLTIGDDVILNTWNIVHLDRDRVWIPEQFKKVKLNGQTYGFNYTKWFHFRKYWGALAVNRTFAEFTNIAQSKTSESSDESESKLKSLATEYLETYDHNVGRNDCMVGSGDIFYIPNVLKAKFIMASGVYLKNRCFVEIALHSIIFGISNPNDLLMFKGQALWKGKRVEPWRYFNESTTYMHPFKFKKDFEENIDGKAFFCERYLKRYGEFVSQSVHNTTLPHTMDYKQ